MMPQFLQRILSYGVQENMEQAQINRVKRINFCYLILFILLLLSVFWSLLTQRTVILFANISFIITTAALYMLIPAGKKPDLNSMLGLSLVGFLFLIGFYFEFDVDGSLVLACYLLFPLAAVTMNGKHGIIVPIVLGGLTVIMNSIPQIDTAIQLELFSALFFFSTYGLVIIIAIYIERSNREMLDNLKDSRNQYESEIVQKDEFISKLSHKLRTSLSNITLVNNLVHDSRLTSEQQELMETLKASTNNLIEDVNNIVEIASPGIVDYKKSIISFDLTRVLEKAVSIIRSGPAYNDEVTIRRSDSITHYLIGDPSLLRSLVVSIVKGLSIYKQPGSLVDLSIDNLRETPSQVRLEFRFTVESDLGEDLVGYISSLRRGKDHQVSNLANAHSLLDESESRLDASLSGGLVSISFFQDFAKDPTRTVILPTADTPAGGEPKSGIELDQAKVLLVEDNEINQKIVLLSLNKLVKQIDVAANGKEALEMFGLKQYDLILMDIMMPVMDGIVATKKIREIESTSERHIPIIAITANALAGDRDNCLAAGVDDYIAKPFQADVLVKMMKNLLA